MNPNYLDFEQPIAELEAKIEELRYVGDDTEINIGDEISKLEEKSRSLTRTIFNKLDAWQTSKLARHPMRPYTLDILIASLLIFRSCTVIVHFPMTRRWSVGWRGWTVCR